MFGWALRLAKSGLFGFSRPHLLYHHRNLRIRRIYIYLMCIHIVY